VLPILLYPLLGMSMLQMSQFVQSRPVRVLVVGGRGMEVSPPLIEGDRFAEWLFANPKDAEKLQLVFDADGDRPPDGPDNLKQPIAAGGQDQSASWEKARALVQSGAYEAAIYFPPDFADRLQELHDSIAERRAALAAGKIPKSLDVPDVPQPDITFNSSNQKSLFVNIRINELLNRWKDRLGEENLKASGFSTRTAKPFTVNVTDVAGPTKNDGAKWAGVLPVLLLLWALTGAFYPAVDLCAGEKERGTLETLLSSPAGRNEIVVGKLLTIMIFSIFTAVLNLASVGATGWIVLSRMSGFGMPPLGAIFVLAVALVPMAALFSALCLALAALARSTREGQYYLMPLLLVTMPLVILPMTPGVELNLGNSLIPVTGVALILRSMLSGNYWQALQYAPVVTVVTLLICLMSIRWAVDQFNRESVLFRESERFDLGLWLRRLYRERRATPTVGMAVCCGVLILLLKFFIGSLFDVPRNFGDFARSLATTQLAVFLLPALLMTFLLTGSPRETLLLRRPRWIAIPAAALLALVLHPVVHLLQTVVTRLYPVGENMLEVMKELQILFGEAGFWPLLLLMALLPAVCEELTFRGFILSGFRRLGHKWRAIVFSAALFGIAHGILQQSLLACLVGVVIGYIAVQSGSIFPCIVFHLIHNALVVANMHITPDLFDEWPAARALAIPGEGGGCEFHWYVVLGGALAGLLLLGAFALLHGTKSEEETLEEAIERGQRSDRPLDAKKPACSSASG
ncbi:MAG: CPBP family intramembrane metalloprotease, partial [Pirellulaceae bacterium]|nr:CPBP family intramembrane metalloprotease [Pirellulaceae bacterium]